MTFAPPYNRKVVKNTNNAIAQRVQISVKLQQDADIHQFLRYLSGVPGIVQVTQTFPGARDPEMASLFVIEIDPPALKSTLTKLRSVSAVEYATDPAPRRLIR